jgi:hypothetical protein
VSFQNIGGGTGYISNYVISLAVVVFTNNPAQPGCVALWDALGSSSAVASAVAENAVSVMQGIYPPARASQMPVYYTYNYYGSMVVVAKIYFNNYGLTQIRLMAGHLSNTWGLGDIVSGFTPTNSRRSADESLTNGANNDEQGGIISSGPFTSDEVIKLHDIISSIGANSTSESVDISGLQKRGNTCRNWDLSRCRNSGWTPWNTGYDYTCRP